MNDGRDSIEAVPGDGSELSVAHWLERLSLSESEADVLATCAGYLAWIGPARLATLPRQCLPQSLETPAQLSACALELVRHTLAGTCGTLGEELAHFFALANARMAQLLRERERSPELVRLFAATSLQVAREIRGRRE